MGVTSPSTGTGTGGRRSGWGHGLRGDVLEVLERSESRSKADGPRERASIASWVCGEGMPGRAVLPDLLMSTGSMGRSSWRDRWETRIQRWVLVDLDDLEDLDRTTGLLESLASVVSEDSECTGRMAVVRTSQDGLQVWVELVHGRHTPGVWCGLPEVRDWYTALGTRLLDLVRECGARGGHLDPCSLVAGRYGRRPGWRWKDGEVYRSHLVGVVRV